MNNVWIDVTGGRLYLEQAGEGSPLLLMHGWTLDHRMFAPQVPSLSDRFRVVSFDRRGFGRSEASPDLGLELDDLDRIADALSLDTLHLLGMSQGGRIALRYAVTRPQRLRSLVLQGAVVDGLDVDGPEHEIIPFPEYSDLARAGKIDEMRQRWLRHPVLALGPGHGEERRRLNEILDDYTGADLPGWAPDTLASAPDVLEELARFHAPALILTGATETIRLKGHAKKLLEVIPNCREVILGHSGHLSNLTEPELYNEQVIRFCAGVDEARDSME